MDRKFAATILLLFFVITTYSKMIMKVEAGDDDKKDKCYKVWEEYKGGCKEPKDKECEDGCKKEGWEKSTCIKDKEKKEGYCICYKDGCTEE
ncbi:OLC1v1030023C1 [Oldenlandia corymbosa var. corymbosa]|uniref:OLC1v1030023C1 n=1 Tax=Oldenlandia corymbosa var. corymbosa TaxID=529605 RepID=A0AAV1CFW2_OLDCO|nr:OLC1v1030023C1 [Oldenlandia corymbosa var. corymbosa]